MPNGIIKVENNFVEYVMYVAEGLKLNMADGLDDDGNKKYFEHTVKESQAIEPYVESTKTISTTCTSATPTENCAKQGNGYARITLVSID